MLMAGSDVYSKQIKSSATDFFPRTSTKVRRYRAQTQTAHQNPRMQCLRDPHYDCVIKMSDFKTKEKLLRRLL